jgi:hypothetical protein
MQPVPPHLYRHAQLGALPGEAESNFDVFGARFALAHPVNIAIGDHAMHEGELRVVLRLRILEIGTNLERCQGVGDCAIGKGISELNIPSQCHPDKNTAPASTAEISRKREPKRRTGNNSA